MLDLIKNFEINKKFFRHKVEAWNQFDGINNKKKVTKKPTFFLY